MKTRKVCIAGTEAFADMARRLPVFIKQVCNTGRLHSVLGDLPPEEFETLIARKAARFDGAPWSSPWSSPWGSLRSRL